MTEAFETVTFEFELIAWQDSAKIFKKTRLYLSKFGMYSAKKADLSEDLINGLLSHLY